MLNACDADTYNDLRGLAGTLSPFHAYENMHTTHCAHHVTAHTRIGSDPTKVPASPRKFRYATEPE